MARVFVIISSILPIIRRLLYENDLASDRAITDITSLMQSAVHLSLFCCLFFLCFSLSCLADLSVFCLAFCLAVPAFLPVWHTTRQCP